MTEVEWKQRMTECEVRHYGRKYIPYRLIDIGPHINQPVRCVVTEKEDGTAEIYSVCYLNALGDNREKSLPSVNEALKVQEECLREMGWSLVK